MDDILSRQDEPRAILSELASLYVLSDYEDSSLSIWYELEDAIDYMQSEGNDILYGGMTADNVDEIIIREAELCKVYQEIDLPDNFYQMMYCGKCDFFAVPKYIRQEMNWLPDIVFTLVFRRTPVQNAVCRRCGNGELLHSGTYEARKRYVEEKHRQTGH